MPTLIGADIGGTNARFQLWSCEGAADPTPSLTFDQRYPSRDYTGLEGLVRQFLSDAGWDVPAGEAASSIHAADYAGQVVDGCCIAICGPVDDENVQSGPSLVEQGPTGWGANIHEALEVNLGAVVKRAVLINGVCPCVMVFAGCRAARPQGLRTDPAAAAPDWLTRWRRRCVRLLAGPLQILLQLVWA